HAEIPPTFWEQYGQWVVVGCIVLAVVMCLAIWFLTRPKPPQVVPAEIQAREAFEKLRAKPEDGALLSRVSQILRGYVTAAFDLPAGELTTTEFCQQIAENPRIGQELSRAI